MVCIAEGAFCRSELVEYMNDSPYSLSTDGSNNNGILRMYVLNIGVSTNDGVAYISLHMCTDTG